MNGLRVFCCRFQMVGLDMLSSSYTSDSQELTHDEERIKEKVCDKEKGYRDMEDKRD